MPDVASVMGAERSLGGESGPGRVVYAAGTISNRVRSLGAEITSAYPEGTKLLMLGLLKGSFIFMADLVRCIGLPVHVDFLVVSSYGGGRTSSGRVDTLYEANTSIEGRHVVLVEDIVDSGHTINQLVPSLRKREPASLEVCSLLRKRGAAGLALEPRWVGFDAPDEFLVGYGLDHAEDFRHLPFIASL
jgi:hypoxanthine phosphoribosyltransferase